MLECQSAGVPQQLWPSREVASSLECIILYYLRFTDQFLIEKFNEIGFKNIKVDVLLGGIFISFYSPKNSLGHFHILDVKLYVYL